MMRLAGGVFYAAVSLLATRDSVHFSRINVVLSLNISSTAISGGWAQKPSPPAPSQG